MASRLLDVAGLSVSYGDAQALWDVSFSVHEGEIFSIIGSNGAGKSTILRTLTGLMQPSSGRIDFLGEPVVGKRPSGIVERGMSLVPEGRGLFSTMTVMENLELGAFTKRCRPYKAESLKWVFDLFPHISTRREQIAGKMSGGEQQMLAIGRALMSRPKLLMLDEPSLGLAPLVVRTVFEIVGALKAQGVTVLLVEQNVHQALKIADRACVIKGGRIVMEGKGADLLADPEIQKAYMGVVG